MKRDSFEYACHLEKLLNTNTGFKIAWNHDIYYFENGKRILGKTGIFLKEYYPSLLNKINEKINLESHIYSLTGISTY